MSQLVLVFTFLYGFCEFSASLQQQSLNGAWKVSSTTVDIKYDAQVPGGIYSDLMNAKVIGDIFYGYNDTETRWVARQNWIYLRQFEIADFNISSKQNVNIVFDGLDTFATVYINGVSIGTSENMFVRYIFSAKNALKLGTNTIEVRFISPITAALNLTKSEDYIVPPLCPPAKYRGECFANQIRKMQASFAWDWGPAFPSMGIWKPVYLEAFNSTAIRYLVVTPVEDANDEWSVKISTYLDCAAGRNLRGYLVHELQTDTGSIKKNQVLNKQCIDNNDLKVDFVFNIPRASVQYWWPNGYGTQKLYDFSTNLIEENGETDDRKVRVGFRKIELVQDQIGSRIDDGLNFYFRVNNVPIFAKGSNQIPIDILPERGQDKRKIQSILKSAKIANMNMLRVWGGGVYESDYFYDLTDEFGILIWQDFMFACAMYPTYPHFLQNVRKEVRHQIRRLGSHPSIALWAGNNENEAALVQNWYGTGTNFTLYKSDYIKLYIGTIKAEVGPQSDLIFVSSSPSNGKRTEDDGFVSANPADPLFGDVHFYNYFANSLSESTYPVMRFASEYGYQSLPDLDAWAEVTGNVDDLQPTSIFMEHRQHHPLGHIENLLLIEFQLRMNTSSPNYYKYYIFCTQVIQAMSIKFETELYRSYMGRLDELGRGNTMGTLYWQLNDVWVAPTWSGLDATGKWKMLHYFAREFFAPTIITGRISASRELQVFVVSDEPALLLSSINSTIDIYNWNDFVPLQTIYINMTVTFGKSHRVWAVANIDNYLSEAGCGSYIQGKSNCLIYLSLKQGNLSLAPNNFVLPTAMKNSNIPATIVKIQDIKSTDKNGRMYDVTVKSNGISLFVWLDSHKIRGIFSENGFLQVTPIKTVSFEAEETTTIDLLKQTLTVTHLKDTQYD